MHKLGDVTVQNIQLLVFAIDRSCRAGRGVGGREGGEGEEEMKGWREGWREKERYVYRTGREGEERERGRRG